MNKRFAEYLPYVDVKLGLRVAGDMELYCMLLNLFLDEAISEELIRSMHQRNVESVAQYAHKLKGTATNLGLVKIFEISAKIEVEAMNGVMTKDILLFKDVVEKTNNAIVKICKAVEGP